MRSRHSRVSSPDRARRVLRDAALPEERQADVARRRFRFVRDGCIRLQVPAWCFVTARGALQRDPPLFEVQQRVVAVKTAQELPHVPRGPANTADRRLCWCVGSWLPGFRPHCRVPLSVCAAEMERLVTSHSAPAIAQRFQTECQ